MRCDMAVARRDGRVLYLDAPLFQVVPGSAGGAARAVRIATAEVGFFGGTL